MSVSGSNETRGIVFHIIHGSFVDGPGVRTTVFLKGCPLRCLWCCNPEGQELHPEIKLTRSKCNQCGNCVKACSVGAIVLNCNATGNKIEINRQLCTNCGKCIEVCFTGALEFFGQSMTVDQVYNVVERNREYYRRSGGGVTIGGGEPTLQPHFTYAFMRKCQENGIQVAIDTCGYVTTKIGLRILEEADLLLFDVKGLDPEEHRRNTGVSNRVILDVLARLGEMGRPIIIRMPLIPGYNDSDRGIANTAEFLRRYESVEEIDLLPYHKFGTVKYEQLGREYRLSSVQAPAEEHTERIKSILESCGLRTQIGG